MSSEIINKKLNSYISGRSVSSLLILMLISNLAFNFMRLHDFTGLHFLGVVRLPIATSILSIVLSLGFLSNKWPFQLKMMFFFFVFEFIRLLIGYFVFPNMVLNDAWHMNTWRDVSLYIFGIMVPICFGFSFSGNLKRLITFFTFASFALSVWGITHSGKGPGGHLGDENDLCLVLILLMPFAFLFAAINKNFIKRSVGLFAGILTVLGIVTTLSRGGFLGFVAVVAFQFILSQQKIKWILSAALVTLVSLPFVPQQYYKEILSIGTDAKSNTGTIDERFRTWNMVIRMWKDPKNTLLGVGLENSRWNFRFYQDAGSGITRKSLLGRATHSTYFQILGDMGIWGILFSSSLMYVTLSQLMKIKKQSKDTLRDIPRLIGLIKSEEKDEYQEILNNIERETKFVQALSIAMLSSWFGVLAAATGISVAYYPTLWVMFSLSAAICIYWNKISEILVEFKALDEVSA